MSNDYDIYDLVLQYLLDEGYAETVESAEVMMDHMSDDWRESIIEAYVPWDFGPKQSPKQNTTNLLPEKRMSRNLESRVVVALRPGQIILPRTL